MEKDEGKDIKGIREEDEKIHGIDDQDMALPPVFK